MAARCANATSLQSSSNAIERGDAAGLDIAHNGARTCAGSPGIGRACRPCLGRRLRRDWAAQLPAARLDGLQRCPGALADEGAFLLGQRRVDMQHEGVNVGAQLGHEERHAVDHEARDEMHITPEAAELRDDDRHLEPLGVGEGGGKLRPAIERVMALARFNLNILGMDLRALALSKGRDGRPLGFEPEPASPCRLVLTRR
jgi:hypothetical protein